MLVPVHSQAQTAAAQAPAPSAPQPRSVTAPRQAGRQQKPAPFSTSNASQQQGNIMQHSTDAPGRNIPHTLSEGGYVQPPVEVAGSRQVQPPLVSRMPKALPQVHPVTANIGNAAATAPGNVHVQSSAPPSVQGLTMQIKQMKNEMIHYASLLDNPVWKQQQPDGGKAVSMCTSNVPLCRVKS